MTQSMLIQLETERKEREERRREADMAREAAKAKRRR
jgi:hypothetical protein